MIEFLVSLVLIIPALIGFFLGLIAGKETVIDDAIIDGRAKVYGKWWTISAAPEPKQ